ncbi:hypothetical protein BG006_009058 [Podila minutissima]|uniref:Uncharacterized protein n=1 Tax=Podila minutissima TaxID=64525 RepID=A0A9P5SRN6_9FUNG|nr:hypothetical protein BG006_009058 [Podila minutissima]
MGAHVQHTHSSPKHAHTSPGACPSVRAQELQMTTAQQGLLYTRVNRQQQE